LSCPFILTVTLRVSFTPSPSGENERYSSLISITGLSVSIINSILFETGLFPLLKFALI